MNTTNLEFKSERRVGCGRQVEQNTLSLTMVKIVDRVGGG
jgi:hypothetical protein